MSLEPIRVKPGRVNKKTVDSLVDLLANASLGITDAVIPLQSKRQNGVYWIATGSKMVIEGMGAAGMCITKGMTLNHYKGQLWRAYPNRIRPRIAEPVVEAWASEPLTARLQKASQLLSEHKCHNTAMANKVYTNICKKREEYQ